MSLYTKREKLENALSAALFSANEARARADMVCAHLKTALDLLLTKPARKPAAKKGG